MMLITIGTSSSPGVTTSSLTGARAAEAGDGEECCTTIEGVEATSGFLACVRSELRREREWERASGGGGDLMRGEMGQWGVLSPETTAEGDFKGRGALSESEMAVGGSWGMLVDERARWMAAADRPGELVLGPRLGLTSVLLLRERSADWDCERALGAGGAAVVRCWLRAGEASRELRVEFAGDGEPDTFSERSRARDWRRIEGICVAGLPDAGAYTTEACEACEACEAWLEVELSRVEAAVVCVGVVDDDDVAGSATSGAPGMMLWKRPSGGAAAVEVMLAAIRLLQLAGALGAALSWCTVDALGALCARVDCLDDE